MSRFRKTILCCLAAVFSFSGPAWGQQAPDPSLGKTPPRLSFIQGEVSFWRPGAAEWSEARINTPLAPGDQLYSSPQGIFEVQIGARAYVRADQETQLGIENHEVDFLQLKVVSGRVSLDLRSLAAGQTIEVSTPSAVLSIEEAGYYRADVGAESSSFLARRGGRAWLTAADGNAVTLSSGSAATVRGIDFARVETYPAPQPDTWDGWNDGRSDQLVANVSSQYVPEDVYGTDELDRHGSWRTVPEYGPIWVPHRVAYDWAPYTSGRWIWDPYYGWTWLSSMPWGWAPFHYGRWVFVDDYWGWAPGPRVAGAVYYPALVGFFGGSVNLGGGVRLGFGVGTSPVGWVALGWGEPIYPWWGRRGFIGQPCWYGWGGPRVYINKTKIVHKTKIVNVDHYRNSRHRNGVVVVPRDRFGRDGIEKARLRNFDRGQLRHVRGKLDVKPTADSVSPRRRVAGRPPRKMADRSVVGTRRPHDPAKRLQAVGLRSSREGSRGGMRIVERPRRQRESRAQDVRQRRQPRDGRQRVAPPRPSIDRPRGDRAANTQQARSRRGADNSGQKTAPPRLSVERGGGGAKPPAIDRRAPRNAPRSAQSAQPGSPHRQLEPRRNEARLRTRPSGAAPQRNVQRADRRRVPRGASVTRKREAQAMRRLQVSRNDAPSMRRPSRAEKSSRHVRAAPNRKAPNRRAYNRASSGRERVIHSARSKSEGGRRGNKRKAP